MEQLMTLKELGDHLKRVPFFPALDLLTVEEDGLTVGVSGKLAYGYRLRGVDYSLYSDSDLNFFFQEIRKWLGQIPEGALVTFLKRSRRESEGVLKAYELIIPQQDELARELVKRKVRAFEGQRFLKKEIFLFLSKTASHEKTLGRKRVLQKENENTQDFLLKLESQVKSAFLQLGLSLDRLTKTDVMREYYRKLNPALSELISYEDVFQEDAETFPKYETLRSRVLLHPPRIEHSSIYLDGHYHGVVNLRTLPSALNGHSAVAFERALPDDSEWILTLRKLDQDREKDRLRVKANFAHANAFFRFSEDHFAREKANQYESILHEMAECGEAIFEISLSVLLKAKDESALNRMKETALKAFPKLGGAVGIADHFEHDTLFLSHLPLQAEMNQMKFPVLTDSLSFLMPLQSDWTGTDRPEILMKTRSDEAFSLEVFHPSLPAKHAVMVGSTGAGKSFTANYLLANFLAANSAHHVVVIDSGGSYRKLAEIFKGSYLAIDFSEDYALSPFPKKEKLFPRGGEFDSDFLAFLTTLLEKMVSDGGALKAGGLRILEKAILRVYETINADSAPLLGDVQAVLRNYSLGDEEDKKLAYQFSKNLSIWTEGRFGKLLNRQGNLSLDNRFIAFDLGRLSQHPELQSILFFVIRSAISRKLDDVSLRKMIVMDEGWRFFNDEVGSRLIEELYRTARKTNGFVLSISQSPEDFLESKASTAILANSYVKYILKLQKGHDQLAKFDLNPNEIEAAKSLETKPGAYSELFLKFFKHSAVCKIEPSPLDYWIATTDPEDLAREEEERFSNPEGPSLERLISLSNKFPKGMRWEKELKHA